MLQQMRGLAKYIWVLVALVFVGGFLLYETSGLMGRTPVTASTAVAVVNGEEIPYTVFMTRVQNEIQGQQQRERRTLSQDDTRRIENGVFDQMVADILLRSEYRRRGIVVSDDEVREFARYAPPPWITQAPELQTDGRFDPEKYQRLLASPQARQGGLLISLEQYYRNEIPREKLYDQIASGVYVSDAELWRAWRDQHDSAQVSYVAFSPVMDSAAAKVDFRLRSALVFRRAQIGLRERRTRVALRRLHSARSYGGGHGGRACTRHGDFATRSRRARSSRTSQSGSPPTPCRALRAAVSDEAGRIGSRPNSRRPRMR